MSIKLKCPSCQKRLSVPDNGGGRKATCPGCGNRFTIPSENTKPSKSAAHEHGTRASPGNYAAADAFISNPFDFSETDPTPAQERHPISPLLPEYERYHLNAVALVERMKKDLSRPNLGVSDLRSILHQWLGLVGQLAPASAIKNMEQEPSRNKSALELLDTNLGPIRKAFEADLRLNSWNHVPTVIAHAKIRTDLLAAFVKSLAPPFTFRVPYCDLDISILPQPSVTEGGFYNMYFVQIFSEFLKQEIAVPYLRFQIRAGDPKTVRSLCRIVVKIAEIENWSQAANTGFKVDYDVEVFNCFGAKPAQLYNANSQKYSEIWRPPPGSSVGLQTKVLAWCKRLWQDCQPYVYALFKPPAGLGFQCAHCLHFHYQIAQLDEEKSKTCVACANEAFSGLNQKQTQELARLKKASETVAGALTLFFFVGLGLSVYSYFGSAFPFWLFWVFLPVSVVLLAFIGVVVVRWKRKEREIKNDVEYPHMAAQNRENMKQHGMAVT